MLGIMPQQLGMIVDPDPDHQQCRRLGQQPNHRLTEIMKRSVGTPDVHPASIRLPREGREMMFWQSSCCEHARADCRPPACTGSLGQQGFDHGVARCVALERGISSASRASRRDSRARHARAGCARGGEGASLSFRAAQEQRWRRRAARRRRPSTRPRRQQPRAVPGGGRRDLKSGARRTSRGARSRYARRAAGG